MFFPTSPRPWPGYAGGLGAPPDGLGALPGDWASYGDGGPSALAIPGFGAQPTTLTRYGGVEDSIRQMKKQILSKRGAFSPKVRFCAESIVRRVSPKDYLSEILAIRHWCNVRIPYLRDPTHVEWMRDPEALIDEIEKHGVVRADCDEYTQLIDALWLSTGNEVELVTVGFTPPPNQETHVFSRVKVPKTDAWIVCDPVAGSREMQMLQKVKQKRFHSLA